MNPGKYIVIEGINGCGKGTQLRNLTEKIYDSGRHVFVSRIRTPNELDDNGRKAREMLGCDGNPYANSLEAVKYFGENHRTTAKHIDVLISMGHHVLCDRNYLSTYAFQHAQGVSYEEITSAVQGAVIPDLTVLLDVPVEVAIERLKKRDGGERRKFDGDADFLEEVRKNYLELPERLPQLIVDKKIVVVNGNQSIDDVWKSVENVYDSTFKDW